MFENGLCKVGHWVNMACEHSLLFSVAMLAASGGNVSWLVGLSVGSNSTLVQTEMFQQQHDRLS